MTAPAADTPRILFIDDDPNLLSGIRRKLHKHFKVQTAEGPEAALEIFRKQGPFAVVVADMQMPGMSGVQLLETLRAEQPDMIRVMLTGNADQQTAVDAVNQGAIFRFLNKPCDTETLKQVLEAALHQHRLVTAEKELLQKTLRGSVKLLVDLLAVVDPDAYGRAMKLKAHVAKLAQPLKFDRPWEVEIAALVSPLGFLALPPEVREKLDRPSRLSDQEKRGIQEARQQIQGLVSNIPRLEGVAEILRFQTARFDGLGSPNTDPRGSKLPLASRVLHALHDVAELEAAGLSVPAAVDMLRKVPGKLDPAVLDAIEQHCSPPAQRVPTPMPVRDVMLGQMLAEDVETKDGRLLVRAETEVTDTIKTALINYHTHGQISAEVVVFVNHVVAEAA